MLLTCTIVDLADLAGRRPTWSGWELAESLFSTFKFVWHFLFHFYGQGYRLDPERETHCHQDDYLHRLVLLMAALCLGRAWVDFLF